MKFTLFILILSLILGPFFLLAALQDEPITIKITPLYVRNKDNLFLLTPSQTEIQCKPISDTEYDCGEVSFKIGLTVVTDEPDTRKASLK